MTSTEKRLLKEAKSGSRSAFGKLVMDQQKNILRLAYDYCGNYDDASEIMQKTFINAYEKINSFKEKSNFSTWLYRIAANKAKDFLREKKKRELLNINDQENEINLKKHIEQEMPDFEKSENNLIINHALEKLNGKQKDAVILKYFHNKSAKEIGGIINCDESTARVHLFRGLEKLRLYLKRNILE